MIDELFVLNPDWERFPSPLREDPRPMDGIYHATFVVTHALCSCYVCLHQVVLDKVNAEVAREAL